MSGAVALLRVLYVSRRSPDAAGMGDVADILAAAARNNPGQGITGALLADAKSLGQALEAPPLPPPRWRRCSSASSATRATTP